MNERKTGFLLTLKCSFALLCVAVKDSLIEQVCEVSFLFPVLRHFPESALQNVDFYDLCCNYENAESCSTVSVNLLLIYFSTKKQDDMFLIWSTWTCFYFLFFFFCFMGVSLLAFLKIFFRLVATRSQCITFLFSVIVVMLWDKTITCFYNTIQAYTAKEKGKWWRRCAKCLSAHVCSREAKQPLLTGQTSCVQAQKGQKVPRLRLYRIF